MRVEAMRAGLISPTIFARVASPLAQSCGFSVCQSRGWQAKTPREAATEVTEIVVAAGEAGLGHAAPLFQHAARGREPLLGEIAVRRAPDELGEHAREVEHAHAHR